MNSEKKDASGAASQFESLAAAEQYKILFWTSPVPAWVYELETLKFIEVNLAFLKRYGYSLEELEEMTILDIRPPEEIEKLKEYLKLNSNRNDHSPGQWTHQKKNGEVFKVEIISNFVHFRNRPCRLVVGTDITEFKETSQKLNLLEKAVDRINDVIMITKAEPIDPPGPEIVYVNDAFVRMSGYERSEVLGKNPRFLQSAKTERSELDKIRHALQNWEDVRAEVVNCDKNGEEFWVEFDIVPIADETGHFINWVSIQRDITERKKRFERELREQRLETLGRMARGIAHDLNNLLTPVLLGVEMLKRGASAEKAEKLLDTIEKTTLRARSLIAQMLEFSRGSSGRMVVLDVVEAVRETYKFITETAPKNIEIKLEAEPNLPQIKADPTQIQQIIVNLCLNAQDAMPSGGSVEINISCVDAAEHYQQIGLWFENAAEGDKLMKISVRDYGSGISPENIAKIFEPFFTTREKVGGTGLGLAIVQQIVNNHGGAIYVSSEKGIGTVFDLYFPTIKSSEPELTNNMNIENGAPVTKGCVLVVDDEEAIRTLSAELLSDAGYDVVTAENGKQAIEMYQNSGKQIEVVVTDMLMPVMDGLTTIKNLKEINPNLKFIVVSGILSEDKLSQLIKHGVNKIIHKPFIADEYLKTIGEMF